jgi:polar amino acid transport system substrate-binding protein
MSAQSNSVQSSQPKECHLIFGWDMVKPLQYFNESGQVVGLQIELTEAILQQLGCQVSYKQSEWAGLISMIKSGQIDFMADATITPERKKYGIFSDSYRKETYTLYVQKEEYSNYLDKNLKQLFEQKFKLGVTNGFIYSDELEKMKQSKKYQDNFVYANSNFKNYALLNANTIDGFIEDSLVAGYTLRKNLLQDKIIALPGELYRRDISYMFSKATVSPELVERFNRVLAKVKNTETYKHIWLLDIEN